MPLRAAGPRPGSAADAGRAAAISRIVVEITEDEEEDGRSGGPWSFVPEPAEAIHSAVAAVGATPSLRPVGGGTFEGEVAATVALSTDSAVRALNAGWRGKDKPTNVLSFPAPAGARDEEGRCFLGDIVLAAETVRSEAAELGISPRDHLQHLVVHGLLHLLGHDHESDADAEAMEALEIEILARLGISNPYLDPLED